jgi:hypothetical protein
MQLMLLAWPMVPLPMPLLLLLTLLPNKLRLEAAEVPAVATAVCIAGGAAAVDD